MSWTDERVERLKKMWAEGLSASRIAAALGGVTRNAVCGKIDRLGLSGRSAAAPPPRVAGVRVFDVNRPEEKRGDTGMALTLKRGATGRPPGRPAGKTTSGPPVKPGRLPKEPPAPPKIKRLSIMEITDRTCKWPIGDPRHAGFCFCGVDKPVEGGPYCAYHARLSIGHAGTPWTPERREKTLRSKRRAA